MDKGFLKEKIKFNEKKAKRSDILLKISVLLIVVGYIFFFSSRYIFPEIQKKFDSFPIGNTIDIERYILTLDSFEYAKEDETIEVILSVDDLTIEKEKDLSFYIREKSSIHEGTIYKEIGDDMIVVRFSGISSSWSEVFMTMESKNKTSTIKMNSVDTKKVESLEDKSDKEYRKYASHSKIQGLKDTIERENMLVNELEEKQVVAYERLDALENKKVNQTEEEQKQTELNKSKIASEMERLKADMDEALERIAEAQRKIEFQEIVLKNL